VSECAGDLRLINRTRELLLNRPRTKTIKMIADDTGLNEFYLRQLCTGKGRDSTSGRVIALYQYLSGKKLEIE
jgi:hypothetical protein